MRYFYPREQQELSPTVRWLAELAHYRDTLLRGQPEHAALLGPRRIGKTLLLKEFLRQTLEQWSALMPAVRQTARWSWMLWLRRPQETFGLSK
ncbi:MAG TPA: hypothetical protein EYP04_13090 [Anaerolineae bacterium]|nr:hypothetical protein [Anaerolineae bacterium]HIQ04556.1 hypothetical protein [Anaerolineae bacterium]